MIRPQRIQLSRAKGFNLHASSIALNGLAAVNISRPGPWGNPFIVGQDGTRDYCIHLFRFLLGGHFAITTRTPIEPQRLFVEHAANHWKTLKGKNLACWCSAASACHGDVLLDLANRKTLCEAL
jgi:hypothetical protein